jgi:hypothetical protein
MEDRPRQVRTRPPTNDVHAVLPELGRASGTDGHSAEPFRPTPDFRHLASAGACMKCVIIVGFPRVRADVVFLCLLMLQEWAVRQLWPP